MTPAENAPTVPDGWVAMSKKQFAELLDERDALVAQAETAEAERDQALKDAADYLRHLQAAEARLAQTEDALRQIGAYQPEMVAWFRANNIVFDRAPNGDLSDWQHVAFLIYRNLCATESIARAALSKETT